MRAATRVLAVLLALLASAASAADPLPSWNDGPAKRAIVDFVARVTDPRDKAFVAPADRIAAFDNDGTLWCEQPLYVEMVFALDRIKALSPLHPEWKEKAPFKAILAGDLKTALSGGEPAIAAVVEATHAGMTTGEFDRIVKTWAATATHPRFKHRYTELTYQPMVELLDYLRANRFKTFIVSGGGVEFMRPFTEKLYGVPPEQVIGSRGKLKFEFRQGRPVIVKLPEIGFIDDGRGKPVGIQQVIGRRPIMAFGNSDGDLQMLEWTTAGGSPGFGLIVHHTDASREYAYDRASHVGRLDKGLTEAKSRGWTVVNMKNDWKCVFAFQK